MDKIAVQLSGHLRTFADCAPSLRRHLLDRYDCDVFIHTWEKMEHDTSTWHNSNTSLKGREVSEHDRAQIEGLYRPKAVAIERQEEASDPSAVYGNPSSAGISIFGLERALYGKLRANRLRKAHEAATGQIYDIVVFLRPDIELQSNLDLHDLRAELAETPRLSAHFLLSPAVYTSGRRWMIHYSAADSFHLCRAELADEVVSLHGEFTKYFSQMKSVLPFGEGAPEQSLIEFLSASAIITRFYMTPYQIRRAP